MQIFDNHGRPISYLRLAVTDRCNLRCFYCMPEEGVQFLPKPHLLTFEEMLRMAGILAELGITKIRITGGEPFVRRDLMHFLGKLVDISGVQEVSITTNGVLTKPHLKELKELGIRKINLSLDTLDRERFHEMTRRDELPKVLDTFYALLENDFKLKVNAVVMAGKNDQDILPLAALSKENEVSVRFIEEMPFNGSGINKEAFMSHTRILNALRTEYPEIQKVQDELHSTSSNYRIPDFKGLVGVIAAFSRTFCGSCNRIRVTPMGLLKTCLYDDGVLNLRDLLRGEPDDERVKAELLEVFQKRPKDGFEAEKKRSSLVSESMTTIGG
ncbi:GTP 3',8-cyclase MoaA [Marinilongibacter aquaticus]|uniref:GTP 3',8-cyclase MoaA n=1 Tax=Marinilongibacter aquaticus TaxID=2975157 RepID=UPI0021BD6C21|nr:GTP 3',8-cyclase MoaA [Marinilongibacter aquaticus]UBM57346.1 GTP 3',8-cyclase MoaA [Marinilongibacter aquaticus]